MVITLALAFILLILCVIVILLENQKKKHLQQLIKEKNRKNQKISRVFDIVFQNIHAFVLQIDRDFNVLRTNYFDRTGKANNDSQKKVGDLLCCRNAILSGQCGTHENCLDCLVRREIDKAFRQKRSFSEIEVSLTLMVSQGKYTQCDAQVSGAYMNIDGEENMVLTIHDITELLANKRRNDILQNIVSFTSSVSRIGFASLNLKTSEEIITPEYNLNLEENENEFARQVLRNFNHIHKEDREELLSFMNKAQNGRIDSLSKDVRVLTDEDNWKWIKVFLMQREYSEEKHTNEIYSVSIDINDQKKTELALEEEKEKAEEADQSKSIFLANMSHEIRTPLNAIVGFSELLAAALSQEEKNQYLEILKTNSEMLLQLINDILDMAKIEAGIIEFSYSNVNINVLMSELEKLFRLRLLDNDKVKIYFEPELPSLMLNTDRNRLAQVISNFMSNAIKFTEAGSITLGYKLREAGIYFYVIDTGLGIKKEMLGNVFGRFARFHKEKTGNGLGLSISKTIIEKLGGVIGVDSEYEKGSTFWFILPPNAEIKSQIANDTPQKKEKPDIAEQESTTKEIKKEKTILIAESDEECFRKCESVLSHKYNILWGHNGEEAVSYFLMNPPNLILMNLIMPDISGYEATEAIRQLSSTIPIIALTDSENPEKNKIMNNGFNDLITKPVSPEVLVDKVEAFCK